MAQQLAELVRSIGSDVKLLTQRIDESGDGASYSPLTAAEAQEGASTDQRTVSASVLKGAITFHGLKLGTTAITAKSGDWVPTWVDVASKPAHIAAGNTQDEARSAIGAGTSNLTLGSTSTTAKPGDWVPGVSEVTGLTAALSGKVDTLPGYGLSQQNFSLAEKQKLAGLDDVQRWKGEFPSLSALQAAWPSAEAGSYAHVDAGVGQDAQKYIFDSTDGAWVLATSKAEALTPSQVKVLYESNPDTNSFTDLQKDQLYAAYGWGNHASAGYALSTDSRFSNAREWTASTVTQTEAEAGTATTRRAWTAQRVRQAITGWWATVESTLPDEVLPPGTNGQVLKHNGTSWVAGTDSDTTYAVMPEAEMQAGVSAGGRTLSAVLLKAAILYHGLKLGSTAGTAKEGDWKPTWSDVEDKPTVIAAGADQAAARAAIGAGTSSLVLGATASTAAAGNHTHEGLMSQAERDKLAGVEAGANAFSLPPGSNGQVLKHNGTTWAAGTDNNTTYTLISDAEAIAGTGIATRTVTPARLKLAIETHALKASDGQALEQRVSQLESNSSGGLTRASVQASALCF